jgi:hypothetical protein
MSIEAMKLALEALEKLKRAFFNRAPEGVEDWERDWVEPAMNAITALPQAIAEAEQALPVEHCLWARNGNTPCPHTTPPRQPLFKEFIQWAGAQGYDCAHTCNSDTGEWIALNPMTTDLWKAWQAANGLKETNT